MTYVHCDAPPANCASAEVPTRRMAQRVWRGHNVPTEQVTLAGKVAVAGLTGRSGRVGYSGTFERADFLAQIQGALPTPLSHFLRPRLEWYGCRGAFFHTDAHYEGVLFGVWCVLGPEREVVFPRLAARVPASIGDLCVFDPFEPHGVLIPGARTYDASDYESTEPSLFLGFEIELAPAVRATFGIELPVAGAPTYSSRIAIHPETGAPVIAGA